MKLKKAQVWCQEEKKRLSLQLEKMQKPQVELEEQITQLGILFFLPMWLSYIRGKIKIVLDVVALTILWEIVWKILVRLPRKQV